ncbi:MAG: TauD/TfdA family dioxygenase [Rhodospirillaceae bacterium]
MSIKVMPATPILGAEVAAVDLSKPIDDATFRAINAALVKHSVICIRDQNLTPDQLVAFSARFGPLMVHVLKEALLDGHPEIYKLSNKKIEGKAQGRPNAGQYWHSDLTYERVPSLGSVMYGTEVPDYGGDTLFASTAHAYDTLSQPMQTLLEGLTAEHLFAHAFRGGMNPAARAGDPLNERPPVVHPVVRVHPENGRKCIFVNDGFTVKINGVTPAESAALMAFLNAHMTRPEVVYRHRWRTGDVVVWDNRALVHRGVGDYDETKTRHMYRTTIADSVAEAAQAAE